MADYEPNVLDPTMTLGPDDPLRAWADQNIDWRTGRLLVQDPVKAIDSLIARGVPPPDTHAPSSALPFVDPEGPPGSGSGFDPVRVNPDGTINTNLTTPDARPPTPAPVLPPPKAVRPLPPQANPLDPAEEPAAVPVPKSRPEEAGPGASDISSRKKDVPSKADALSDFAKSLQGVKPVQPPPLNPVGTPSVRSPSAVQAPNISSLLALTGNARQAAVLPLLGRLLVQGKA